MITDLLFRYDLLGLNVYSGGIVCPLLHFRLLPHVHRLHGEDTRQTRNKVSTNYG